MLPMTLAEYMDINGLRDADMASRLGIDRSNVSRLRRGKITPSAKILARIASATDGQVTANDFFPPVREAA